MGFRILAKRLISESKKYPHVDSGQFCLIPGLDSNKYLVSLTQHAKDALGDVVYIELKAEGSKIKKGGMNIMSHKILSAALRV
jgi:glycine cleavage system H lipoate-binding protein